MNDVPRAPSVTAVVDVTSFPGVQINSNETVTINANASDPDSNDTIWYKWYVAGYIGGQWTEFMLYDWSTGLNSMQYEIERGPDYGFPAYGYWIKWRCEVKDETGLTDENYTATWLVWP